MSRLILDFDNTLNADPAYWAEVVEVTRRHQHGILIVSQRRETAENRAEIKAYLESVSFPKCPLMLTNGRSKVEFLKEHGMPGDWFVDDDPKTCAMGV